MCEVRIVYRDLSNLLDVSSCDPPLSPLHSPLSYFLVLAPGWKYQLFVMVNIPQTNTRHRNHIRCVIISGEKKLAKTKKS